MTRNGLIHPKRKQPTNQSDIHEYKYVLFIDFFVGLMIRLMDPLHRSKNKLKKSLR